MIAHLTRMVTEEVGVDLPNAQTKPCTCQRNERAVLGCFYLYEPGRKPNLAEMMKKWQCD